MGNEAGHRVRLTAAEGQKLGEAAMRGRAMARMRRAF